MAAAESQHSTGCDAPSSALERKRAAIEKRLNSHYESYLHDSSIRRSQTVASLDPAESMDHFLSLFAQRREKVEQGLALVLDNRTAVTSDAERTSLKGELENLLLEIGNMEKLVADASYHLPTYSSQSAQASIAKLKEEVEAAIAELLPKKKFSFRKKIGNVVKKKETSVASLSPVSEGTSGSTSFQGIQGKENGVFVRDSKDLEDREFVLSNLSNCKIYLRGKFRALFMHKLSDCHVYAGPVSGSVLIEEVQGSVLMLASHQIRIHSTKATDLYLRVRSRPIVEYTSDVRFAPYAFHYSGIEEDLQAAHLIEETGLWESVDDFRWLRAVQSPNWSILPPDQRVCTEVAPMLVGGNAM